MNRFAMLMPRELDEAVAVMGRKDLSLNVLKAGGIDLLDHFKEGLTAPMVVTNLRSVKDASLHRLEAASAGALATLAEVGASEVIAKSAPAIVHAARATATPQIRNVATIGGNLLQRPRCWYYRNQQFDCLKKGGHMCFAVEGENRYHAIFGPGPCHIVHPSNLAPALSVCEGTVTTRSASHPQGGRTLALADLFVMPDRSLRAEHVLESDEVAVRIEWKAAPSSAQYEIREKQSFDWPLVMVAAALEFDRPGSGLISRARLCAGAVAPIPWRLTAVEKALVGVNVNNDTLLREVCAKVAEGAAPMSGNSYKLQLLSVATQRAVRLAAGLKIDDPFHDA